MQSQSGEMSYAFPEWTPCAVKDYHDGMRASIVHRVGNFVSLVTGMRGEWREPVENNQDHNTQSYFATGIAAEVCQSIAERQQAGIAKYATSLADADLTHAQILRHAREEAQDLACYLTRAEKEAEAAQLRIGELEVALEEILDGLQYDEGMGARAILRKNPRYL